MTLKFRWQTEHTVGTVLLLALCLPVAIYFIAYHAADQLRGSLGSVAHSQELMLGMDQVALDMATAQHDQFLSLAAPRPNLAAEVIGEINAAQKEIAGLKRLAAGDQPVEQRIAALGAAVQAQAQDLHHSLAPARLPQQAQTWLTDPGPRARQKAVRDLAAADVKAESDTLAYWRGIAARFQARWRRLFWGACLISLGLLLGIFYLAVHEIRKRRRAQEALALSHEQLSESWERYHSLIANVPAAVWTIAPGGGVEFMSAQAETMTGYAVAEIMAAGASFWREHTHAEDWGAVAAAFAAVFTPPEAEKQGGNQLACEFRFQHKDGRWIWLQALGQVAPRRDGPLRADGVLYDISDVRRSAELALKRRELEFRDREMQRAYQVKNDFLAAVSHELRTPLSAILGFSDLLAQEIGGELNAEQRSFAHHIHRSGELLLALINDVLDLSRLEAGAMPVKLEAVRFDTAAADVLATLTPLAKEKQITLEATVTNLMLWADPLRFRQILLNLVNNAIKFTPATGQVRLEAGVAPAPGAAAEGTTPACARISVIDTGVGIKPEDMGIIFDRFRQLGHRDATHPGGAGLGLAIAKHLAERQGGALTVESTVGVGTAFHVFIPLAAPEAAGVPAAAAAAAQGTSA